MSIIYLTYYYYNQAVYRSWKQYLKNHKRFESFYFFYFDEEIFLKAVETKAVSKDKLYYAKKMP